MYFSNFSISDSFSRLGMTSTFLIVLALLTGGSFALNVLDGLKTGVVYQFELTTQTRLTNREHAETVDEQESSAAVFAQLLHWDHDSQKRVFVIWADNCINAVCPKTKPGDSSSPPPKLFSIWRGSRVSELLSSGNQALAKWDVLRSLIFHLQYELETAKLRPIGFCDAKYSEVDPKSRVLTFCRLPEQTSLLDKALEIVISNFTQTSQYFFDASSKLRHLLASQSRLKLVDQSQPASSGKEDGVKFEAYVEILKKEYDLRHLADSVEQLFAAAAAAAIETSPPPHTSSDKCGPLGGVKNLQRLISPKTGASLKTLLGLSKNLRSVEEARLLDCLDFVHQNHEPLIQPLLGSLAVAGRRSVQKTVFRFLDTKENDEVRRSYLLMLAHNPWPAKVASEVLTHLEKSTESVDKLDEHLALAAACIVRRSEDVEAQERLLETLGQLLSTCGTDQCLGITLRAFRNLAHPKTADYVAKYFCHKSDTVAREALESMRSVDARHYTNESLRALERVYTNHCPNGNSDSSSRTTAAELLLKVRPDERWVAGAGSILLAPLLSSDNRWKSKREREIYTYSLAKLFDLSALNPEYRRVVAKGTREILHNDYSRLAPGGLSTLHTGVAADFDFGRALSQLNMEYSRGVTKRSNVDINLETKKGAVVPLLSVALVSRYLDMVAPGSGAFADDDFPSTEDETQDVTAGIRLAIFDRLQPPVTFFTGQSELMAILWNANGDPVTAFEGQFLTNDLRGALPLASGHRAVIDFGGALWWKMTGAVEVSLWYGNGHTTITNHLAYLLSGGITVGEGDADEAKALLRDETKLSAGLAVDFETDVEISKAPFRICLQLNQRPLQIKYTNRHKRFDSVTSKKQSWKREKLVRIPGHCFVTEPKIARECGDLLQRLGRE